MQSRSPYPSSAEAVNPADVRGRKLGLPQEICVVSGGNADGLRGPQGRLTTTQKSAEGVVGRLGGPKARTVPDEGLKERASSSDVS